MTLKLSYSNCFGKYSLFCNEWLDYIMFTPETLGIYSNGHHLMNVTTVTYHNSFISCTFRCWLVTSINFFQFILKLTMKEDFTNLTLTICQRYDLQVISIDEFNIWVSLSYISHIYIKISYFYSYNINIIHRLI